MGNALRLLVFCLAVLTVTTTAALSHLWVRQRSQSRYSDPPIESPLRIRLEAEHSDQRKAVILNLTITFASLLLVALAFRDRSTSNHEKDSRKHFRDELNQVEHFARTAAVQEEALRREREDRRRTDETLSLQQLLLNQALGEKLKLGRDLHDGVIQSLYATGLTFECARQKRSTDALTGDELFERGMNMLNDNIREIRRYIDSLSDTTSAANKSFSSALERLLENLKGNRNVEFSVRIDEAAESCLTLSQMPDILQISREAISNALRHGAATCITIRLHQDDNKLAFSVHDNGTGFDPAEPATEGHGLANFRARAQSLGGSIYIDSHINLGTRIVLTVPVIPSQK